MRIVDNTTERNITFGDLNCGDIFKTDYGYFLIKMQEVGNRNAIDLEDGETTWFGDDDVITPLPNARLVID